MLNFNPSYTSFVSMPSGRHFYLPVRLVLSLLLLLAISKASLSLADNSRPNLRRRSLETHRDWPEWCVNHMDSDGFVMKEDADNCWTKDSILLRNFTSASQNTTNKISLDIQNKLAGKNILFLGDSIARYAMHAFRSLISNENPIDWKFSHESLYYEVGKNSSVDWKQAWPASEIIDTLLSKEYKSKRYDHVFLLTGAHEVADYQQSVFEKHIQNFTSEIRHHVSRDQFVFQTATPINETGLYPEQRTSTLTDANVRVFNKLMAQHLRNKTDLPLLDGYWTLKVNDMTDGLHSRILAFATAYRYAWYLYWKDELVQRGSVNKWSDSQRH